MLNLGAKGSCCRPSPFDSFSNGGVTDAHFFRPCGYGLCLATKCKKPVISFVSKLLFWSCPAAVIWAVAFGVFDPVKAVPSAWSMSHIREKAGEAKHPLSTNSHASTTIPVIISSLWIEAPILHIGPDSILRGAIHPVNTMGFAVQIFLATPATESAFVFQVCAKDCFSLTTITSHKPSFTACVFFDGKKPECLASQIFDVVVNNHASFPVVATAPLLPLYQIWRARNA